MCLLLLAARLWRQCQLVMSPLSLTTAHPTLEVRNEFYRTQLTTSTIDAFLGDAKPPTASMKKLIKSLFFDLFDHDLTSNEEEDVSIKALEAPTMLLEEGAVANALCTAFVCKHCNSGKITIVQHPKLRKSLCTYPTLVCEDCKASMPIVSSYAGESHRHAVNLRSALAKVAIGESHSSFEKFCCLMYLPPPPSKSTFVEYHQLIGEKSQLHVEDSLKHAREEVRQFYGAVSESEIVDC